MNEKKVEFFLDSGAYSAKTQGAEIKISDYISFIQRNIGAIDWYANLDVIGDGKATFRNQRIMEDHGLSPLPVFHFGEESRYLKYYIKNYEYMCIGGMVGSTIPKLIPWLDDMFSDYFCDIHGVPKVKVHGFGITSLKLLLRYPWYSVDSTSWVRIGAYGSVYVPRFRDGKYDYNKIAFIVAVSNRSSKQKVVGQHLNSFSPRNRDIILEYFKEKGFVVGVSEFKLGAVGYVLKDNEKWCGKVRDDGKREVEVILERGLCNEGQDRIVANLTYFLDVEKGLPAWPWVFEKKGRGLGMEI